MKIKTYGNGPAVPANSRFTGVAHNWGERGFTKRTNKTIVRPDDAAMPKQGGSRFSKVHRSE